MNFMVALFNKEQKELTFEIYIADAIKLMGENKTLTVRFADLVLKNQKPEDNRSGEEIALSVLNHVEKVAKS
jgi:hypothetical protein